MPYTNDLDLNIQDAGAADWDNGLNANFQILERGFSFRAFAGTDIATYAVCVLNNSAWMSPYDARSLALGQMMAVPRISVSSGAEGLFFHSGVIRSMSIGSLMIGDPVFPISDGSSLGLMVHSYAGCREAVGYAVARNAVVIKPYRIFPDYGTIVLSGPAMGFAADSAWNFNIPIGQKGQINKLTVRANSLSAYAYKIFMHSNSSRVNSELIYETLTRSWSPVSSDVTSSFYLDGQGFPYRSTEINSYGLIHGRVQIQSGHGANSGSFSMTIEFVRY